MTETPNPQVADSLRARQKQGYLTALEAESRSPDPNLTYIVNSAAILHQLGGLNRRERWQLKRLGKVEGLNRALTRRLRDHYRADDPAAVLTDIDLCFLLGVKMDKAVRKHIPTLTRKAQEMLKARTETVKPKRRFGRRGVGALALGGLAYVGARLARQPTLTLEPQARTISTAQPVPPTTKPEISPIATSTPEVNKFADILKPLIDTAMKQRTERSRKDPEYAKRIDNELASRFLTINLMTYWEEHGISYADMRGSMTLISYDLKTNRLTSVSFSRDIRTPEIERLIKSKTGQEASPQAMGVAFKNGGFDLMLQVVMKDTVIRDLINDISGQVTVNVPKEHKVSSWRLDGKEQDPAGAYIPAGEQTLDALGVMRLIEAEDGYPDGKQDERSYRKNLVMHAVLDKVKEKVKSNRLAQLSLGSFLTNKLTRSNAPLVGTKELLVDFDWNLIPSVIQVMGAASGKLDKIEFPEIDPKAEFVLHDPYFGDGSVSRISSIKDSRALFDKSSHEIQNEVNKTVRALSIVLGEKTPVDRMDNRLIELDAMPLWMLIPDGGDPTALDLLTSYWQSTRKMVKEKLLT